jgi:hypothetical protein
MDEIRVEILEINLEDNNLINRGDKIYFIMKDGIEYVVSSNELDLFIKQESK